MGNQLQTTKNQLINKMFKTILFAAAIVATNAVNIEAAKDMKATKDTGAKEWDAPDWMDDAMKGDYTSDDLKDFIGKHKDTTPDDIMKGIKAAGKQGMGFEHVKALIEGAGKSGSFDKHDLHDFFMGVCKKWHVTPKGLKKWLSEAGGHLGISEKEGKHLLGHVMDTFDITKEEMESSMKECFRLGSEGSDDKKGGDKKGKGKGKKDKKGKGKGKKDKKGKGKGKGKGDKKGGKKE